MYYPAAGGSRPYYWDGISVLPGRQLGTDSGEARDANSAATPVVAGDTSSFAQGTRAFRWQPGMSKVQDLNTVTSGMPKGTGLLWEKGVSNSGYVFGTSVAGAPSYNKACILIPK